MSARGHFLEELQFRCLYFIMNLPFRRKDSKIPCNFSILKIKLLCQTLSNTCATFKITEQYFLPPSALLISEMILWTYSTVPCFSRKSNWGGGWQTSGRVGCNLRWFLPTFMRHCNFWSLGEISGTLNERCDEVMFWSFLCVHLFFNDSSNLFASKWKVSLWRNHGYFWSRDSCGKLTENTFPFQMLPLSQLYFLSKCRMLLLAIHIDQVSSIFL